MPTSEPPASRCLLSSKPPSQVPSPKYLKEDEVTEECRDLLSSLPRGSGWVVPNFYKYQGFWHHPRQLQGVLSCQKHFEALKTDLLLVTTPKSGTTWLKAILFSLVNRTRYHKSLDHPLLTNNPHVLVPFLELKVYLDNPNPDFSSFPSPRIFSTHLPFVSLPESVCKSESKLVYLCRDPKDTLVSLWHFSNKLRLKHMGAISIEEVFDKFCEGVSLYGPFWDHVLGYWNESVKNPRKVLFLKYEELKEQPSLHLRKIADFIGRPFSAEEEREGTVEDIIALCSFDYLSNLDVNKAGKLPSGEKNETFFRKGEVGDWKNYLTAEMVQRIEMISEEKLCGSGLEF